MGTPMSGLNLYGWGDFSSNETLFSGVDPDLAGDPKGFRMDPANLRSFTV